jgi:GTPase Era involved in 16S rRNA processing
MVTQGTAESMQPMTEGEQLATQIERAAAIAQPIAPFAAMQLDAMLERLLKGRLQLAVLGQFKRGKSTLVNALLGTSVLPAGVIPLTSVPTFISWGPVPRILVTYSRTQSSDELDIGQPELLEKALFKYVAEEANPKNVLGVKRVDLFFPSPLLQKGIILIDTPGIGSIHQHNTDAALSVLPECDAAIFVTSADPPMTEAELAYLDHAWTKAARMYFVLNKADYLEKQDLEIAIAFLKELLSKATGEAEPVVHCVSALSGLKAKQSHNPAALEASGIASLEGILVAALEREKLSLLRSAIRQRAVEEIAEVEADVLFKIRTLEMPIEELHTLGTQLNQAVAKIIEDGKSIHDLLEGDHRRITASLENHAEQLRERSRRHLNDVVGRALNGMDREYPEIATQHDLSTVVSAFFEDAFQASLQKFGGMIEETLARRARHVDDIVNDVRKKTADLFDVPFIPSLTSERLTLPHEPYWLAHPGNETLTFLTTGLISRALPKTLREARVRKQLAEGLATLVQRNVENLRWAIRQGIEETFRRFGVLVEERTDSARDATQGAVEAAAILRAARAETIAVELSRLRHAHEGLVDVRSTIGQLGFDADAHHTPIIPS